MDNTSPQFCWSLIISKGKDTATPWREHLSAEVAALAAPKESLYTEVADFGALCYQSSGGGSLAVAFFALVFSLRNDSTVVQTVCSQTIQPQSSCGGERHLHGGASQMVVAKRLVHVGAYTGETTAIALADAARRTEVPVTIVEIQSPFIQGRMKVLVMEEPIVDVLIGNYCRRADGTVTKVPVYPISHVAAVTTCAQEDKGTQRSPPLRIAGIEIGVTPEELGVLQREDPSLRKGRETCEQGITHPTWQIVVPDRLRTPVMTLAHDAPMSGHLAAQRTLQRVFRHIFWLRMCASCVLCQKTVAKGRVFLRGLKQSEDWRHGKYRS
ncbi:hypothetical protein ACOMHN_055234 [Nucella lapillus]